MALTPSGAISMSDINSALGRSSTASISFNDSQVRFLANQDTGSVNMNAMRNKYNFNGTITVGQVVLFDDILYGYKEGLYRTGSLTGTIFDNTKPQLYSSDSYSYTEIGDFSTTYPNISMRLKVGSNQATMTRGAYYDPSATYVYYTSPQELITAAMNNTTVNWQFSQA